MWVRWNQKGEGFSGEILVMPSGSDCELPPDPHGCGFRDPLPPSVRYQGGPWSMTGQ
jgi:hypothetical protein